MFTIIICEIIKFLERFVIFQATTYLCISHIVHRVSQKCPAFISNIFLKKPLFSSYLTVAEFLRHSVYEISPLSHDIE